MASVWPLERNMQTAWTFSVSRWCPMLSISLSQNLLTPDDCWFHQLQHLALILFLLQNQPCHLKCTSMRLSPTQCCVNPQCSSHTLLDDLVLSWPTAHCCHLVWTLHSELRTWLKPSSLLQMVLDLNEFCNPAMAPTVILWWVSELVAQRWIHNHLLIQSVCLTSTLCFALLLHDCNIAFEFQSRCVLPMDSPSDFVNNNDSSLTTPSVCVPFALHHVNCSIHAWNQLLTCPNSLSSAV